MVWDSSTQVGERVDHLAVDVQLELVRGPVADPDRA
jgi:hypothetical protein